MTNESATKVFLNVWYKGQSQQFNFHPQFQDVQQPYSLLDLTACSDTVFCCFRYFDRDVECIFKFFRKRFVVFWHNVFMNFTNCLVCGGWR